MAVAHPRIDPEVFDAHVEGRQALGFELLDGQVVVVTPDGGWASNAVVKLVSRLGSWVDDEPGRGTLLVDAFVTLDDDRVAPDLAWWSVGREPEIVEGVLREAEVPDLVVEVLGKESRRNDLGYKRDRYRRFGVVEYWIVDPKQRTVTVDARSAAEPRVLGERDILTSPLLPGFALDALKLFPSR